MTEAPVPIMNFLPKPFRSFLLDRGDLGLLSFVIHPTENSRMLTA